MRAKRAVGAGFVLAALAAGPAEAATPELSIGQRLQDRREVAAGTRAQALGFQDGRFYANGWHTTGEMGGIITPPLKLLDSLYFGVNGQWVGPATEFRSGWGYVRYRLPSIDGFQLERTDFAPDGRRGALLGLKLTSTRRNSRTVRVMVDAHSELMTQYPWGFAGTVPNASDNVPDSGSFNGRRLVFRDRGRLPGEESNHSYTAIVGSNRDPQNGKTGPGHYGPFGAGRVCAADQMPAPMPSECDDGPFGRGTGGRLRYKVRVPGGGSRTIWIAVAGSENSRAEARGEFLELIDRPAAQLAAKRAARAALGRWSKLQLPGNALLQDSIEWGKQNLADLTQTATDLEIRWTNEGKEWTFEGDVPRITWVGAGFPDYPWLFAVDGEYTTHANVTLGQFESIKDHMRAIRDVSDVLNDGSGVVVHEVVADGSVWHGKGTYTPDAAGVLQPDFNTDEIVKFPGAVALIWRWTGDDGFRDEMLDFTRRNLRYVRRELDVDGDGWPEGNGNVERAGMGEEKLDNTVYYIRGLYDYADMARSAGQPNRARRAEERADALVARFDETWWIEADQQYGDSLDEDNDPINQKHWIGVDPMEVELFVDGEFVPGLAPLAHGDAALATRENNCYSGERPGNRGLFHTGCGGGPAGAGEFAIFSLGTGIQAVGEGNYGRLGAEQQRRYTDAAAETQFFSQQATGGTPDEQPGAMPEIFPSNAPPGATGGTAPNITRCWTCRSMFMQSWGHYGTAWAAVHQQLGVRPHLGRDFLEVVPQVPDAVPSVQGADIRLGGGSADVLASHAGGTYTTETDTSAAPDVAELRIGHTLPHGSTVASVMLDGVPAAFTTRATNRGLEVRVPADPDRRHTLVVTAGS